MIAGVAVGLVVLGAAGAANVKAGKKFYADDPIWSMPKPVAAQTDSRKLSDYYDFFENTFTHPGLSSKRQGGYLPSQGINTVDEVPDSAWYTNRHATHRMSAAELKAGPGNTHPPAEGKWTVVAAKNEGVTPGFRIKDSAGRQYLLKFDPPSNPEMASAADVLVSKFFYALGYNVPENYVVYFDRDRLEVGKDAQIKDSTGHKRDIHQADVIEMLAKTPRSRDGKYRALASLLIGGKPIGPFNYHGTRGDDPNDLIPHELRRDLRGLRTLCAWLGHDDSKSLNSLDVLAEENGTPFVKHYLIDFGAALGSASFMANSPRDGNVYLFDWKSSATQFFTFGLYAPKWQRAKYPKLPAVGRFEYEIFDPVNWVGDYPNAAFRNENLEDKAWAARKINSITDEDIRAMVATGEYTNPESADWITRCLIERKRKVVSAFLSGTAGLDRFAVQNGRLESAYVGPGTAPSAVKVQWSTFDNQTGMNQVLAEATTFEVPKASAEFLMAELRAPEGPSIRIYLRIAGGKAVVAGVERQFPADRRN